MKRKKIKSIGYGFYCILMIILSVLGWILYNVGNWVLDTWGLLSIDEIIFHLKVPDRSARAIARTLLWN